MQPEQFKLHFLMPRVPDVAKRGRHVLILLQNAKGNFILGTKHIYPAGISRMVGGGIESGEDSLEAAQRELVEETQITAASASLLPLTTIFANLTETTTGKIYSFITYLYYYAVGDQPLRPSDDLDNIVELTGAEYQQLIQRYTTLSPELDKTSGFAWSDYGKLYGKIHQIALDALHHVQ